MLRLCLTTLQCLPFIQAATYLYIDKRANFENARRLCQKHGLDLVKVTSKEVQQDVNDIYRYKPSSCAWLGLHVNGELFGYYDGTALRYTNWNIDTGEPDHLKTDRCGCLNNQVLKWHSRRCYTRYQSLCGPILPDDTYKIKVFAHQRWHQDVDISSHPTYVAPQTSLLSCAKDCAILKCHYFSLDGKQCKMYTDDTDLETQPKKGSTIWKRN